MNTNLQTDEGREEQAANTLRGTLLLRMANSRTLQKHRVHHPSKAPCLHPAKKVTSIVKKLKERAFNFPGKLPAPSILFNLLLRLGAGVRSRELLPDLTAIYGQAKRTHSPTHGRSRLPRGGELFNCTNRHHRKFSHCTNSFAQPALYKTGLPIMSSTFL